jgi:hypothetical protein
VATSESFPIVPGQVNPLWFWVPVALTLAVTVLVAWLMARTVTGSRSTVFHVSREGLHIEGDIWGRSIPMESLAVDQARALDLAAEPDLQPKWKRSGSAVPGYASGWFSLRNKQKALVYLTDRRRVLYVPTTEGYVVMLSVSDPDRMAAALRTYAGR